MNSLARFVIFVAVGGMTAVVSAQSLDIRYTATGNTLVRPTEAAHYLILPVEDDAPDSKIYIWADGALVRTLYVRLAQHAVDYTVPFDLTPYAGREILFNVVGEGSLYPHQMEKFVCWKALRLADAFDTANREKFRPVYHHTPLYGWMNDPNGMFWKDGAWHLCFQHNPYGSKWQNLTWGHSVSHDLMHWTQEPSVLEPDGLGSVFSGSAVVDHANTAGFGAGAVVALFTSAGKSQVQSLAYSTDGGATFTRYAGNPVIVTEQEARDPKIFWNERLGKWNLILAHALDREMLIYSSPDLKTWSFESAFGRGYGCQKGVWECPDLFELPVRGTNEKRWVLICNINPGGPFGGSAAQYFIGDFDGHRFVCDTHPDETLWMDYGKDHYAAVTWSDAPDNRRTAIAWMSNWQYADAVPTLQFRSANTLPRDLELFRASDGTLRLAAKPAKEVERLRRGETGFPAAALSASPIVCTLPTEANGVCEIDLALDFGHARKINLVLSNEAGESVEMTCDAHDAKRKKFIMYRQQSGATDFSLDFPATTVAPMPRAGRKCTLRIFLDRCSIEVFGDNGEFAMTDLVFPASPYTSLILSAEGGAARMEQLTVYPLGAAE
jgi:sucrose-6-phosphate hydrolase SacC (GH32 family)